MSRNSTVTPPVIAPFKRVQPALAFAAAHADEDPGLAALAAQAGLSVFHLHRMFSDIAGETPKQYTLRLRVSRGAALLLTSGHSVLDVALSCGFRSHEAFTRAFRRQFGMAPRAYRARGLVARDSAAAAAFHAALVRRIGPCVGLFHVRPDGRPQRSVMTYSIVKKDLVPQPVLIVRRRVKRSEIAAAIGEALPHIFQYAQQHGIALAGHPFTRYVEVGAGLLTIEPGMRVVVSEQPPASVDDAARKAASRETPVIQDTLPGGPAATTVHAGTYETLSDAYAALETWMESQGLPSAGPPWESYITDPAEHPDPKDWKTEVCWPVR
jgi:AraC family transcriptional regulator